MLLGDAAFALMHYLAMFAVIAILVGQLMVCQGALDSDAVRRLSRLDLAYLIAALFAVATGLLRAFLGAKGWSFYSGNPFFWAKVGTFVVIGLLSIPPTLTFARWRKTGVTPYPDETAGVRKFISWQTRLLPLLPVFAVLMARGIGS